MTERMSPPQTLAAFAGAATDFALLRFAGRVLALSR